MTAKTLLRLFASVFVLLIIVMLPVARAYVQRGDDHTRQSLDKKASTRPPTTMSGRGDSRIVPPGHPWHGRGPEKAPSEETTSAPVSESGTLTLASLGLLALGAAMRKPRGAHTPTGLRIR